MHAVHPVFHVSMLKPAMPNTFNNQLQPLPPPVVIDGKPKYEIACIVNSKINHCHTCKLLYTVIWLGYGDTDEESSWLPATELANAMEYIANFHTTYPSKPGPLPV
jgi:hypothetical protein